MTTTDPHHDRRDGPGRHAAGPPDPARSVLDQIGGPRGFAYSAIPVLVFVTANAFWPLSLTVGVSLAVGLGLTGLRLLHGEGVVQALGSLIGVAVAAGLVAWTGSARDFFAIGIWISLAGFVAFLGSVLVRRPLTGVAWNLAHGGRHRWRADRTVLRAHDVATLTAAVVFGSRFAVQQWLYLAESTGGLGVARIAMGTPLSIVAVLVAIWAFRRSSRRLLTRP